MNFSDFTSSLPIKNIYLDLHETATAILDEKLHYFSQEQFSVDIYKLAAAYEIKVYDKDMANMNLPENDFPVEMFGYLNTYYGQAIYLNRETRNLTRRYTVAYHLAYYLLNNEDSRNYVHYLAPASFSVDFNEQLCHLLASFLLMPIETVAKLMMSYKEKGIFPSQMNFNSWLDHLGNTMGISAYYTAIAFNNVRTLHIFLKEQHAEFLK